LFVEYPLGECLLLCGVNLEVEAFYNGEVLSVPINDVPGETPANIEDVLLVVGCLCNLSYNF
jgi:hypothetical protein